MSLLECFQSHKVILMEGALGQRLKTEFGLTPDDQVALAGMLYQPGGREALESLWREYMAIARRYRLPLLVTTPLAGPTGSGRHDSAVRTPSSGTMWPCCAGSRPRRAARCT